MPVASSAQADLVTEQVRFSLYVADLIPGVAAVNASCEVVASGEEAARVVDILLSEGEMKGDGKRPGVAFLVTDDPERFRSVGESFFGERIDPVEKVSL